MGTVLKMKKTRYEVIYILVATLNEQRCFLIGIRQICYFTQLEYHFDSWSMSVNFLFSRILKGKSYILRLSTLDQYQT